MFTPPTSCYKHNPPPPPPPPTHLLYFRHSHFLGHPKYFHHPRQIASAPPSGHLGYAATSRRGFELSFPQLYRSVYRAAPPPALQLGGTSVPTPTQGFLGRSHPVAEQARQLPPASRGLAPHGMWQPLGAGEAPPGAARPDQAAALGHSPGRGQPRPKLVAARRRLLAERAGPRLLALRAGPDRRRDPILGRPHSALINFYNPKGGTPEE